MNTAEEKAAQRESMRAKRGSIAADVRKNYEAALEDRLLNLPALKHAKCIAVYYPTGSEARFVSNREKLFLFDQRPTIAFPLVRSETNMSFFSFDMNDEADAVENAVRQTIRDGYRTGDIMSDGMKLLSCTEMGSKIAEYI